ncbi:MAG: TIGR01777 family oxidoreductase [Chitinophagaceae bacterium]
MPTIVITGGTGLIGNALSKMLISNGYDVIVLTRDKNAGNAQVVNPAISHESLPGVKFAAWDIKSQAIDAEAIKQADFIIHLAGAGVADKRWTAKRKSEIVDSRIQSSALLVKGLKENHHHVKAVLSASAIGWYGADRSIPSNKPFVETDLPDSGFLGETCKLWEESIEPVALSGIRLVKFRTGIVLSKEGGAFPEFKKPVRFGVAGILGNGKQVISWIHIDDLCRMYLYAIENELVSGAFNAVAPKPVSNKELTIRLAQCYKKNFYVPMHVPSFVLQIMLGEMKEEVLKSATVCCDKIRKAGFNFIFPSIENALNDLLRE